MKEEGRKWKEGGKRNERKNGSCRTRKKMCRSGSKRFGSFPYLEKKIAGLPFLLLPSSFNSRNIKAESTPGQLLILEDTV